MEVKLGKSLKEYIREAVKESRKIIENYCEAEDFFTNEVDFSVLIDGDVIEGKNTFRDNIRVKNACEAGNLVSSLLKGGHAKSFIRIYDNRSEKTVVDIALYGEKCWYVGILGSEEEVNEWRERERKFE